MPATLLRPYYLQFRNRFHRNIEAKQNARRDGLLLLIALTVMGCIFIGFVMILNSLENDVLFREIIPVKLLELLFYGFFILQLISTTIATIGNVYNAKNMNLFLAAPVSTGRLFAAKFLETLIETSLMFVIFALPVGLAYLYSVPLEPGFMLASAAVLIPFLLIPTGIAFVLGTVFVNITSLIWKRGRFLILCLFGVVFWGLFNLFELLDQVRLERGGGNAIVQLIGLFDNPNPIWMPSRWAADLISYFVTGSIAAPEVKILLLLSTSLGSIALGYLVFDAFMLRVRSAAQTHETMAEASSGKKTVGAVDPVRQLLERLYYPLPIDAQLRAVILKDLTALVRDRAQSLQLLMYLGIALAYLIIIKFMSAALNLAPQGLQVWWAFLASINVMFAGFIITAVMTRLVYPSISLEGRAFWILNSAPIRLSKLIGAKFWCWLPLTISIVVPLLLAGVVVVYPTSLVVLSTIFVGICMSIGCTGLAIGIGSCFATFEWESPNQIAAGLGTLVLLLSSLALVLITTVPASILTFILMVPLSWLKFGYVTTMTALVLSVVSIPLLNVCVARFACKKGAAALLARRDT